MSSDSPLESMGKKIYDTFDKWGAYKETGTKKSGGGADAKMVEEANESYRKADAKRKASANPKLGSAKKSSSKKGKKKQAAKK